MPDNPSQFNYPSILQDASSPFPFVSLNIQPLPVSLGPADDLYRELESIRLSASFHHQTSVPRAFEDSPLTMFQLPISPTRTLPAMLPLQDQSPPGSRKQDILSRHTHKI